jgi:hypothetical protein
MPDPHDDLGARGAHERLESLPVVARPYIYRYTRCATGSNANLVLVRAGARRWEMWLKTWPRPPYRVSHSGNASQTGRRGAPQRMSDFPSGVSGERGSDVQRVCQFPCTPPHVAGLMVWHRTGGAGWEARRPRQTV